MSDPIKRAPAGTCEYLVRGEDGKLRECGDAAAWRGRKHGRLLYCEMHGQIVGKSMAVIALAVDADGRRRELKPWKEWAR